MSLKLLQFLQNFHFFSSILHNLEWWVKNHVSMPSIQKFPMGKPQKIKTANRAYQSEACWIPPSSKNKHFYLNFEMAFSDITIR